MDKPLVYQLSRQRHRWVAMFGRDNRWKHLSGKPTSRLDFPGLGPVDPFKTRTLIGWRWKCGNVWSWPVLIGREAYYIRRYTPYLRGSSYKSRALSKVKVMSCYLESTIFIFSWKRHALAVFLARRKHLFPFRTQKLSFSAAMVLPTYRWESSSMQP